MLQRTRPNPCLSPSWYILCKGEGYLPLRFCLVHSWNSEFPFITIPTCGLVGVLRRNPGFVYAELGISWVFPKKATDFLSWKVELEHDKTKTGLWIWKVASVMWFICWERNVRLSEDKEEKKKWCVKKDQVQCFTTGLQANNVKGLQVADIQPNWMAALI